MTQLSNIRMEQIDLADRETPSRPEKYHPHCGEEHRHKPTKAMIGIALLIVLSCLLYGITGHANEPPMSKAAPQTASHMR